MKRIKVEGYIQCENEEFENTPNEDKLSICYGNHYKFLHYRKKKTMRKPKQSRTVVKK